MTNPPRTRPGKTYPGGRTLRRRLTNLARRRKGYAESVERDVKNAVGMKKPGSMQ